MNNKFGIYQCLLELSTLNQNCKTFNDLPLRFLKVRDKSFDFITIFDDESVYCYTVYAHEDGYRIRKTIYNSWIKNYKQQYQLFRNSRTGEWPAFKTPKEMFEHIEKYLLKKL